MHFFHHQSVQSWGHFLRSRVLVVRLQVVPEERAQHHQLAGGVGRERGRLLRVSLRLPVQRRGAEAPAKHQVQGRPQVQRKGTKHLGKFITEI